MDPRSGPARANITGRSYGPGPSPHHRQPSFLIRFLKRSRVASRLPARIASQRHRSGPELQTGGRKGNSPGFRPQSAHRGSAATPRQPASQRHSSPDPRTAARGGMTGGAAAQAYGEAWYWDERYRKEAGPFDWYQKYPALAPLLRLYLAPHHRLLLAGCGNSVFGENMIDDGYQDVVNIDISSVVIEQMKKKYHDKPQLKYMKMDVKNMSDFESGSFDAVIDKGTLDSIMCGQNSQENATKMLEEVNRILKENGVYMLITYGDPSYRLRLLKDMENWTVKLHVIERWEKSSNQSKWELTKPLPLDDDSSSVVALLGPKPDVHYIYVCVKGNGGASRDSKAGEAGN